MVLHGGLKLLSDQKLIFKVRWYESSQSEVHKWLKAIKVLGSPAKENGLS